MRRISLKMSDVQPSREAIEGVKVQVEQDSGHVNMPSGTLTRAIPIVGMPYLIRRNPHNFHFPRIPHISPAAHLFPPGTHLFFRFIMKLAGSPDSQPKRLTKTPSREISPNPNLLYFSNISQIFVERPVSSQPDLEYVPPRNFSAPLWSCSQRLLI